MDATASEPAIFRCAKCRTGHPWAAEYVGKTARCACGHVLKVPALPAGGKPAGPAAKTVAPQPPAPPPRHPSDDSAIPAFLRMPTEPAPSDNELDPETEAELASLTRYGKSEGIAPPEARRDIHIPLAMLLFGAVITFIDMRLAGVPGGFAFVGTFAKIGFYSVLFLAGALLAAKFAGIYLGQLGPALLKLAAVSVTPAAIGDLVTRLLGGDMAVACIGGGVGIIACWGCVSYLFRLEFDKTLAIVGSVAMVKLAVWLLFGGLIMLVVSSVMPDGEPFDGSDGDAAAAITEADTEIVEDGAGGNPWLD